MEPIRTFEAHGVAVSVTREDHEEVHYAFVMGGERIRKCFELPKAKHLANAGNWTDARVSEFVLALSTGRLNDDYPDGIPTWLAEHQREFINKALLK